MAAGGGVGMTWQEELTSLVEETGIRYSATAEAEDEPRDLRKRVVGHGSEDGVMAEESFKDQVKGFLKATGEMMQELGRGCKAIVEQSLVGMEDSYVAKKLREPWEMVSVRLRFLNEFLPEDRDPMRCWLVVALVLLLSLSAMNVNTGTQNFSDQPKILYIHPPSAARIQLPDGRYMAYHEQGVPAERARFSLISPHSFLSSRLAGIPGIKASLLEEFGVRLVTYDLPGFGESDPHPDRNLNSSAMDMLSLATAVGVQDNFWVLGYSGGGMHAWAALRYIPYKIAGAALFAPMCNPYESGMTKEESYKTWEKWTTKRKLMYILAKRFPSLLPYFYRRSFLSGRHGQPEKWLSLSLGKKDKGLMENQIFREFWERDVEEAIRQRNTKPFVEEAVLQVSRWGFNLADLQVQKHEGKGLFSWFKSLFNPTEREWAGFQGPIHIWQGMEDRVVPPSMTEFARKVVPGATVHKLLGEGHFSYFCFCDECHRQIFSTLFGIPQGPLSTTFKNENENEHEDMDKDKDKDKDEHEDMDKDKDKDSETPAEQNFEETSDDYIEQNELS
ncbi:hypothetical protein J5N97_013691 [Dioscorea zingiberensis]|uniref:AB hydrolase-1 domain-containing protein n=1 Tax=Dioscorea zingiberensis TaxID=325984 RepID=A0A9D5CSK1_9LILI|nr:hypothetical protein J5N97_013691 [Dioscorea zingiberensis]